MKRLAICIDVAMMPAPFIFWAAMLTPFGSADALLCAMGYGLVGSAWFLARDRKL